MGFNPLFIGADAVTLGQDGVDRHGPGHGFNPLFIGADAVTKKGQHPLKSNSTLVSIPCLSGRML